MRCTGEPRVRREPQCHEWSAAFQSMLVRTSGHLGPFLPDALPSATGALKSDDGQSSRKTLHYINDLTNTLTCDSPFHSKAHSNGFTTDVLKASIIESPGELQALAMVILMIRMLSSPHLNLFACQGLCWVPWWDSKLHPPVEHDRWFQSTFNVSHATGGNSKDYFAYILRNATGYEGHDATPQNSGDILGTFAAVATSPAAGGQNKRAAISFRIQDFQFCDREPSSNYEDLSRFWYDNRHDPSFMISGRPFPDAACKKNRTTGVWAGNCNCDRDASMTWANPAVLNLRKSVLLEAIGRYPTLDVEIDYLRSPILYNVSMTPLRQRRQLTQGFLKDVKAALGQRRLGVRIPPDLSLLDDLGIELQAQTELLDYVTASIDYNSFMPAASDFVAMRRAFPGKLLWEVSGFEGLGAESDNCSSPGHWRLSDEQLATIAHQAFALGSDGISAFNFECKPACRIACLFRMWSEPTFAQTIAILRTWAALGTRRLECESRRSRR